MCSLNLTHPSAHTPGAVHATLRCPVSSWGFGALLKGLTSVMDNSCRSRDSNPQPQVTSSMLYPLGHDCPWPDSNASSVSPGTGLCLCYFSALCFTKLQSFGHSFFPKTISGTHQLKAAGVGAQGEPNHCGSNVTGLSLFPTKKSALEAMVYIIQHIQWFFLFQGNV